MIIIACLAQITLSAFLCEHGTMKKGQQQKQQRWLRVSYLHRFQEGPGDRHQRWAFNDFHFENSSDQPMARSSASVESAT